MLLYLLLLGQTLEVPETAPVGPPVIINAAGVAGSSFALDYFPQQKSDILLELYDRQDNPVTLFWTLDAGPRSFVLAYLVDGQIEMLVKTCKFGGNSPVVSSGRKLVIPKPADDIDLSMLPKQSKPDLACFYHDFANVVRRDIPAGLIETKQQFRDAYIKAGQLCFQETGTGSPELAEAIDKTIQLHLGLDRGEFDHDKAYSVLMAIAWSFNQ